MGLEVMKYLKAYKLFESTEQDLKDILLELKDMGYRIIYEDDVKGVGLRSFWYTTKSEQVIL